MWAQKADAGVRVEQIDLADKRHRARFLDMVHPIYAGDCNFIAPLRIERMKFLDPARNPSFENLEVHPILAHRGGKIVGRMTAHVDRAYDAYHHTRSGWFGFFECINDRGVAHAMLADGARWLKDKGANDMMGPFNFTTNHQVGLLVENFDRPPFVEMTYNPPYYEELLTSFGFGKAKDLYCWWIDIKKGIDNPKVARIAKIAERIKTKEGVTIRTASMKDFDREVERIFALYNEAWQKNWGFVKVSREEFEAIAHDLKQVIVPEFIIFVEFEGRPVGFALTLPNINQLMPRNGRLFPFGWTKLAFGMKSIRQGRMFTLGVVPQFRRRGLESLLFVETVVRCKAQGIDDGEAGWTLEDNDLINRAIETMDGRLDRRYRILGVLLS